MKTSRWALAAMAACGLAWAGVAHAQSDGGRFAVGAPSARVEGAVSGQTPGGESFRIPGVTVRLRRTSGGAAIEVISDDRGEFSFADLTPAQYALEAALDGFTPFTEAIEVRPGAVTSVDVRLALAPISEKVTVVARSDDPLDPRQTAPPAEVARHTLQQVPLAAEQFLSALPLVPGVVRGPDGLLNMKGARESQSGLQVNNASVADPVTGEFAFRLPIEAVESVQVVTGPFAPEYGRVTGGITKIETRDGGSQWAVEVQNVTPRLRRRGGEFRGVEAWTPRFAIGGPLAPERLFLFESVEYQLTQSRVEGLPALESDTKLEALSSFTQLTWAPTTADRIRVGVAVFPQKRDFLGLDTFNPQPVTPNLRQRGVLLTTSARRVLSGTALVDVHVSLKTLDTDVHPSTAGDGPMILAPIQNRGTYFNTQRRDSQRYEALGEYTLTPAVLDGDHVVKAGAGVSRESFDGDTISAPVVIVRADGSPAEQVEFSGPAALSSGKTDLQAFVQDKWSAGDRLTLDYGVRYDWDSVAETHHVVPRVGFSFLPTPGGRTVLRGGAGLFYDKLTLNATSFDQLPARTITRYLADGVSLAGHASIQRLVVDGGRLRNPESVAWNLELDRELSTHVTLRVGYQQREGSRELVVEPPAAGAGAGAALLRLANSGRSRYRELEFTSRYVTGPSQLVVSVRPIVGDRRSQHAEYLRGRRGGSGDPAGRAIPSAIRRAEPRARLGRVRAPRRVGHRAARRGARRLSPLDRRREPRFRGRPEPRGPVSAVLLARHAGVEGGDAPVAGEDPRAHRRQGLQPHEPLQPPRLRWQPRQQRIRGILERRQPDAPWEVRVRFLT